MCWSMTSITENFGFKALRPPPNQRGKRERSKRRSRGRGGRGRVIINGISNGELILKEIKEARRGWKGRTHLQGVMSYNRLKDKLSLQWQCNSKANLWPIFNSNIQLCNCCGVADFSANRQNAQSNFYLANDDVFSCNFITLVKGEFRSRSTADAEN